MADTSCTAMYSYFQSISMCWSCQWNLGPVKLANSLAPSNALIQAIDENTKKEWTQQGMLDLVIKDQLQLNGPWPNWCWTWLKINHNWPNCSRDNFSLTWIWTVVCPWMCEWGEWICSLHSPPWSACWCWTSLSPWSPGDDDDDYHHHHHGKGLFTYYVSQKQRFLHPPSPLRQQWSAFSLPPLTPSSAFVSIFPPALLYYNFRRRLFDMIKWGIFIC